IRNSLPLTSIITITPEMHLSPPRSLLVHTLLLAALPLAQAQSSVPAPNQKPSATSSANLKTADTAFRAGSAAYQRNDLRTAHAEFAKLVKLAPTVAVGHAALGTGLLAAGAALAAATELELAHKLAPTD